MKKKSFFIKDRTIIFGIIILAVSLIVLLLVPFTKPHVIIQKQIQPAGVSPFPGGDACSTSKATGATGDTVFPILNLIGDGKTDDYSAIQSAINNASGAGGGVVSLPAGTFVINEPLTMKNNVTLEGIGSSTIIKAGPQLLHTPPSIGYSIVTTNGASNVTIENFTADQQGTVLNGNSVDRFLGYIIHVYKSTNVIVNGVYTRNPFAYAIVAENSTDFCFKNNNTQVDTSGKYDQLDGIHVLNSSFGDVIDNDVDQGYGADGDDGLVAHTIGGTVHDIMYAGNKVRGGNGGSCMQLALTNATDTIYNITIQNNECWGSPRGIRTGYYGGKDGSVYNITIGGSSKTGNYIHDNTFKDTKTGDAVNIYGNGIDPHNITVTYNKECKAGTFSVGKGKNNIIKYNTSCLK